MTKEKFMSLNKMIILGRLGKDVELSYTKNGNAVASLSVATTDKFKNSKGEYEEETDWHNVVVFGKLAENCSTYLEKGRQIWLEGKSKTRSWEDKEGNKKYRHEVVANNIQFLDKPNSHSNSNTEQASNQVQDDSFGVSDLDIPF